MERITISKETKEALLKELKNNKMIDGVAVPKLTDNLKTALQDVLKDVKIFSVGIEDGGTCVCGMSLYIKIVEPRKRKATQLDIVHQLWQGSTPNEKYFKLVREFLNNEFPAFGEMVKMDWGRMD